MAPGKTGVVNKVARGSGRTLRASTLERMRRTTRPRTEPLTKPQAAWYDRIAQAQTHLNSRTDLSPTQSANALFSQKFESKQQPRPTLGDAQAARIGNSYDFDPLRAIAETLNVVPFDTAEAARQMRNNFPTNPLTASESALDTAAINAGMHIDDANERRWNTAQHPHWRSVARALGLEDHAFERFAVVHAALANLTPTALAALEAEAVAAGGAYQLPAGFDSYHALAIAHELPIDAFDHYREIDRSHDACDDPRELRPLSATVSNALAQRLYDAGTVAHVAWIAIDWAAQLPEEFQRNAPLMGRVIAFAERIRAELHAHLLNPQLVRDGTARYTQPQNIAGEILMEDVSAIDRMSAATLPLLEEDWVALNPYQEHDPLHTDFDQAKAHAIISNGLFVVLAEIAVIDRKTSLRATMRTLFEQTQLLEQYRPQLTVGFDVANTALCAALHDLEQIENAAAGTQFAIAERRESSVLVERKDAIARLEEVRAMFLSIANAYTAHYAVIANQLAIAAGQLDLLLSHFGIGLTKPASVSKGALHDVELGILLTHPYQLAGSPAAILQGISQVRDKGSLVYENAAPDDILINLAWRHPMIDDAGIAEYQAHAERALQEYTVAQETIAGLDDEKVHNDVDARYEHAIFSGRLPEEISAEDLAGWIAAAREKHASPTGLQNTSPPLAPP